MQRNDRIRLQHMLDAARDAAAFSKGRSRQDLDTDRQLVLAVIKCLEILGEAANRVTPEGRQTFGDLPWRDIIDMRHRLIHGYYDINHGIVWSTLQEDIPALIQVLERVLKPSDDR